MDKWPVHLNTVVVRHTLFVPKGNTMFTQNDCESRRISLFFHRPMNGKHVRSHSPISDVKRHITRTHTHYITSLSYSCNSEPVLKYPSSHETRPWHIISPSMSGTFRLRKTISPKRLRNAPELSLHGSMAWRRNLQPKTKSICFKWQWVKQFFR